MPQVEKQKKKSKSKKKISKAPKDTDELFLKSLDEMYYLPKNARKDVMAGHMEHIITIIDMYTTPSPLKEEENNNNSDDQQICKRKYSLYLPMAVVPVIVRSLGFVPTDQQLRQIAWLVKYDEESNNINININNNNSDKIENDKNNGGNFEESYLEENENNQETLLLSSPSPTYKKEMTLEIMMNNSLADVINECKANGHELLADRKKLENLLLGFFKTGLLVFDPTNNNNNNNKNNRLVSVMSHANSITLDGVFDIIWLSSNKQIFADGTRFVLIEDIKRLFGKVACAYQNSEPPMTQEELDVFFSYVCDVGCDVIREDTFVLATI